MNELMSAKGGSASGGKKTISIISAVVVVGLVLIGGFSATASHLADGLVGYWDFDDATDPTADLSGHGNDGDVNGGAVFTAAGIAPVPGNDNALTFDGVDDYVEVSHDGELDMTTTYSVSVWVNVTDVPSNIYRPIAFRGTTDVNDIEIYVQAISGDLIVAHNRGNGGIFDYVGFDNPPVGSLFHLAVVYDGTSVTAYYDGVAAAVVQQTSAVGNPNDTDKGWWFGKVDHFAFGTLPGGSDINLFKGLLDEVRIYNRDLSSDEVGALADYSNFSVDLAPAFKANSVGKNHTVTATLNPALSNIPVLFEVTGANPGSGSNSTDGDGKATFAYTGNNAGKDTITACVDADLSGDCTGGDSSAVATKVWISGITIDPELDYNPTGTSHTVTADIGVDIGGVELLFVVSGVNPSSDNKSTDSNGVATYTYDGINPGTDIITVCLDEDSSDTCDQGELSDTGTKYWLSEYVTGGGVIKESVMQIVTRGKVTYQVQSWVTKYTFGGNVGFVPGIENPVGQFQIVDHTNEKIACHFNSFDSLTFSGGNVTSPYSEHNTATFTASGTCNDGSTPAVTVKIQDLGEPGARVDKIAVDNGDGFTIQETIISGGNFQIHPPEFLMLALYEKNPSDWTIVPGGASGVLAYEPSASTFNYYFTAQGLNPGTNYSLIYYADPWPGNHPGAFIASGVSDGSGNLSLSGSAELNMDLPTLPDANYPTGAKVWLVLSSDYDGINTMTGWNPTEYLFENNLIQYDDTDVP